MRDGRILFKAAAVAALFATGVAWQPAAQAHEIFYSGKAIGVEGTVTVASLVKKVLLAANYMSCLGRPKDETVSSIFHPAPVFVRARTVTTFTLGRDNVSSAQAALNDTIIEVPGLKVEAAALDAYSEAKCRSDGKVDRTGNANVLGVKINGEGMTLTGEPNQTIEIPNVATVIFNEQQRFGKEFRTTALRIKLFNNSFPAHGELAVAFTRARVECTASQ